MNSQLFSASIDGYEVYTTTKIPNGENADSYYVDINDGLKVEIPIDINKINLLHIIFTTPSYNYFTSPDPNSVGGTNMFAIGFNSGLPGEAESIIAHSRNTSTIAGADAPVAMQVLKTLSPGTCGETVTIKPKWGVLNGAAHLVPGCKAHLVVHMLTQD